MTRPLSGGHQRTANVLILYGSYGPSPASPSSLPRGPRIGDRVRGEHRPRFNSVCRYGAPQAGCEAPGLIRPTVAGGYASLLREAIEQAVAAGGDEVRLGAAARLMRCVPGALGFSVGAAPLVDMAEHRLAEFAARPVAAGNDRRDDRA